MNAKIIGNRIKLARKARNMTQEEVAKELGLNKSTIQRYETGNINVIKLPVIAAIARTLHVNPAWISGKSDQMEIDDLTSIERESFIPIAKNIIPIPRSSRKVPLLGKIACGVPVLAEENIDDYVDLPDNIDADFCLKCVGDSMEGARIMDGDIVYIHQQPMVDDGEIAAVMIDNEATLKRVYYDKEHDTLQLVAENPKYRPFVYHGTQLDEIKIIGRAVAFLSRVRK